MATLYLIETRAAATYRCSGCGGIIPRGTLHFRHDPHPMARRHRGEKTGHWCHECVRTTDQPVTYQYETRRLFVRRPDSGPSEPSTVQLALVFEPVRIELVGVGRSLSERMSGDPSLIHRLSPDEFEEFICERLYAMGMEPKRIGSVFQPDGGIDVVFWPRGRSCFPFLGAAQIKHHGNLSIVEGSGTVREFIGSISGRPFSAGIIITNTSFSVDAEWAARTHPGLVRLRGFLDICRWLADNFASDAEWRELPSSIELAPGVSVRIRDTG